jgi:hypothetical protein
MVTETPEIHPEMLVRNINQFGLIEKSEQLSLDRICDSTFELAVEAYEYWLSVLRWKTESYRIGRDVIVGNAAGTAPTLCTVEPHKKIWGAPIIVTFEGVHRTTVQEWDAAANILVVRKDIPPHIALLQDAQEYQRRTDYRRSIIDIAIACEVFLRSRVLSSLPNGITPAITASIESINISQFIAKFFPDLLDAKGKTEFKRLSKHLTSLFDARNKIMHMDNNERSTSEQCVKFIDLAKNLFNLDVLPTMPTPSGLRQSGR